MKEKENLSLSLFWPEKAQLLPLSPSSRPSFPLLHLCAAPARQLDAHLPRPSRLAARRRTGQMGSLPAPFPLSLSLPLTTSLARPSVARTLLLPWDVNEPDSGRRHHHDFPRFPSRHVNQAPIKPQALFTLSFFPSSRLSPSPLSTASQIPPSRTTPPGTLAASPSSVSRCQASWREYVGAALSPLLFLCFGLLKPQPQNLQEDTGRHRAMPASSGPSPTVRMP